MSALNHLAASGAVSALRLTGTSRDLAARWLSLWSDKRPPSRTLFYERCDRRFIPAIAFFEVRRGQSIRCLYAGSYFRLALGFELSGQDVLALTPAGDRQTRLERAWKIGDGAILIGRRNFRTHSANNTRADELYLPLSDASGPDKRTYLMHTGWRPSGEDWIQGSVATNLELVRDLNSVPLR